MHCATCGQPLSPPPVEGGASPSIVLMVGSAPMPLRCGGCARVVCHVCQTKDVSQGEGMAAAHISLDCPSCGDQLEIVRGANAPPTPEPAAPLTDERKRELKQAYMQAQRDAAPARVRVPPGAQVQALLDAADTPTKPEPVAGGCVVMLGLIVGAFVGYDAGPEGSVLRALVGAGIGLAVGGAIEGVLELLAWLGRKLFGSSE